MNRREFIKATIPAAAIPAIAITCKYEDDEKGPEKESKAWPYRVYCYERQQGEWCFSKNIRGSFAYQREYMTFDEENDLTWNGYAGWMDGGILHFSTLIDATDFVDMHVRTKEDINIIDSIYDIYYKDPDYEHENSEMQVAHYWFNGDTGRQIHWVSHPHDWSKVECS
tara:strand:- start:61 stop:564 length:504 start_codon:yes stop_codon:yes gene_type:complete